ncbi:MAG: L-threonylcarbamoyladenylate synthase [Proteobacteria bacterium]|nr:L-threonylcarbamoyladenylate synthase [Pseudomonadota bacterium]
MIPERTTASETPAAGADPVAVAVARLADDGLVAFPTETVWGLAARAESEAAMERLRRFKGRDAGRPVSILVSAFTALASGLGCEPGPVARALADGFWPGPLTLVLPSRRGFATGVARADGAVGVRCTPHPVAGALVRAADAAGLGPLTATSLNPSGEPPAARLAEARRYVEAGPSGAVPFLLDLGRADAHGGEPSTVVDLCEPELRILRAGAISADALTRTLAAAPQEHNSG